jgi:hypothetical protein
MLKLQDCKKWFKKLHEDTGRRQAFRETYTLNLYFQV